MYTYTYSHIYIYANIDTDIDIVIDTGSCTFYKGLIVALAVTLQSRYMGCFLTGVWGFRGLGFRVLGGLGLSSPVMNITSQGP